MHCEQSDARKIKTACIIENDYEPALNPIAEEESLCRHPELFEHTQKRDSSLPE